MTNFEQKYGYLLLLYPKRYREEWGGEILAVLAENGRPTLRERGALAVGGLRTRLRTYGDRTVAGSWLSACYLAAMTLLLTGAAGELLRSASVPTVWVWAQAVASVLAFGFAWKRWILPAAVVAVAAVAFDAVGRHGVTQLSQWLQPLAVLLLIPLIGRKRAMPPRWLAVLLLPIVALVELPSLASGFGWVPLLVVLALAVPVTMLDHRVGMALALIGILGVTNAGLTMKSFYWALPDMVHAMWLPTLWPVAVLVLGGLLARRRARI
jgi:hypothetical protein